MNTADIEYKVIRSRRKTMSLSVTAEGLLVRAPLLATNAQIRKMIAEHRDWIEKSLAKENARRSEAEKQGRLTGEDIRELAKRAAEYIPERVKYYAPVVGVTYGRITIGNQRTRWGSCSAAGNLSFNCLLMLTPPEVIDSVVVHELCHRLEMNHSERFYAEVLRVLPDYRRRNKWLKTNGPVLMKRIT